MSRHVHVRADRVWTHVCRRAYDKLIARLISMIQRAIANKTFRLLINREFLDYETLLRTSRGGARNKNNLF